MAYVRRRSINRPLASHHVISSDTSFWYAVSSLFVISLFYDEVVRMGSNTVMCEKSVQHRAKYTAPRSTCVHYDGVERSVFLGGHVKIYWLGSSVSIYTVQKGGTGYAACL